jgi:4-hydroxy-3-methylbut-2-enyl diphosphate reductase
MVQIKIAEKAGFCFGVKRAVDMAEEAVARYGKVYTLGPIIHNPQEVSRLDEMGIEPLKSDDGNITISEGVILLRTHGIAKVMSETLERVGGLHIIDATCPFVKKAQDIIKKLPSGETVIIVGEHTHPEVVALKSYANGPCIVIETLEEARSIKNIKSANIVSQTTQTVENFDKIVEYFSQNFTVKVFNTICQATFNRQLSAKKLAEQVDVMIVIGGKNSGNTTRLFEICSKITKAYHIEANKDISKYWFEGVVRIGITAGASTPDWIIEGIKLKIQEICYGDKKFIK